MAVVTAFAKPGLLGLTAKFWMAFVRAMLGPDTSAGACAIAGVSLVVSMTASTMKATR